MTRNSLLMDKQKSNPIGAQVTDARDGQSRTIRQFHFTDWPEQGVPKSGEGFIDFIGQVHKTKEQFGQEGPITVHCRYEDQSKAIVLVVFRP